MTQGSQHKAGATSFFTLQQIAVRHPGFTIRTLRYWIAAAKDRYTWKDGKRKLIPGNGFDGVMVQHGRRIYIDEGALLEWLEEVRS